MEDVQWKAVIESLIFVSESPLSLERIKEVLGEVSKKDPGIAGSIENPRG